MGINMKYLSSIMAVTLLLIMSTAFAGWAAKEAGEKTEDSVVAKDKAPQNEALSEEAYSENVKELMRFLEGRTSSFVYERYGRPDPFQPFLRDKDVAKTADTEIADYGDLTGMRKFEPGQLLVVAIVLTQKGHIAMVQDSTGKGYVISPGLKLGKNGVIEEITDNMVLVKQKRIMTSGAVRYRDVRMLLKREGE